MIKSFSCFLIFFCLLVTNAFAAPKIDLPNGREYGLGELEEGKIYERSFIVANSGDSALEVKVVRPSCGCTNIIYPKQKVRVSPGESVEIKFSFNSEGMEGIEEKYIYVESNDPDEPAIKLKLTADVKRSRQASIKRFLSLGLFTVLSAGLIDGINPCAFTVLVFFISFLTFVGYDKKRLAVLGITFILSVFITYMLIGIGMFRFIQSLEAFSFLSKVVSLLIAALAVILGIYSLYDWYIYRKTSNPEEIKLKLPDSIKQKIQKIIRDSSRDKKKTMLELILVIFTSGFSVTLLESVCTGQTYVPTIAYVLSVPDMRRAAFIYLALYNLMFIAPLAAILIAGVSGLGSGAFSQIARRHIGKVKLLTAALFFLLGFFLFMVKWGP